MKIDTSDFLKFAAYIMIFLGFIFGACFVIEKQPLIGFGLFFLFSVGTAIPILSIAYRIELMEAKT